LYSRKFSAVLAPLFQRRYCERNCLSSLGFPMSFASALSLLQPALPYYLAVARYDLLHVTTHSFEFRPDTKAPALALEMVKAVFAMGVCLRHAHLRVRGSGYFLALIDWNETVVSVSVEAVDEQGNKA
jgi:hypothetical protein